MSSNNKLSKGKLVQTLLHVPDDLDKSVIDDITAICKYKGEDWINDVIKNEKITPFAAHILMSTEDKQKSWEKIHKQYEDRNIYIISILNDLFSDFHKQGINNLVVYENFGALLVSNSCVGCFSSGDVDISANIEDREAISKVLKKHSFIDAERRGKKNSKIMTTYYNSEILESGFYINFSWQPISRRLVFNNKKLKKRLEIAKSNSETVGNTKIKVLGANELMYFSILHIALGHYYVISPGYRLYIDVDRIARSQIIDWDIIFQWAKDDGMEHRFVLTLNISSIILDTPIPEELKDRFKSEKKYKKLFDYLYNEKSKEFMDRGSRTEKLYIDFLSDDVNPLTGIINRLINSFKL